MTGNVAGGVGDALVEHFFGADKGGKLTVEMFGEFHRLLRTELLRLEVRPHPPKHPLYCQQYLLDTLRLLLIASTNFSVFALRVLAYTNFSDFVCLHNVIMNSTKVQNPR